jgi:hypothetical protein
MAERRTGDFVRGLIDEKLVTAVHDISDGGLVVAIAEMALAGNIGARLYGAPAFLTEHGFWFGEDQARYVVTDQACAADDLGRTSPRRPVCRSGRIGMTTGAALTLPGEREILLNALRERHEGWLPAYYGGWRELAACLRAGRGSRTWRWTQSEIEKLIKSGIPRRRGHHPRPCGRRRSLCGDRDRGLVPRQSRGVQQHQLVYQALRGEMGGKLHCVWRCRPARRRAKRP